MPVVPPVSMFDSYKELRQNRLDSIMKINVPQRPKPASRTVIEELESYWNVDGLVADDKLLTTLIGFYRDKVDRLLQQNLLLLSRWARFCRTSYDATRLYGMFQRQQNYLQSEYSDAVDRFERLSQLAEQQVQQRRAAENAKKESEAKAQTSGAARTGTNATKGISSQSKESNNAGTSNPQNTSSPRKQSIMDSNNASGVNRRSSGIPNKKSGISKSAPQADAKGTKESGVDGDEVKDGSERGPTEEIEIGDLVVYIRWLVVTSHGQRDLSLLATYVKAISEDRNKWLRDYRLITTSKPGQNFIQLVDAGFAGINMYIESAPVKLPKIEDFICEFELLISHFGIDTPIGREDGRPFAYECDAKFHGLFSRHTDEYAVIPPHDASSVMERISAVANGTGNAPNSMAAGGTMGGLFVGNDLDESGRQNTSSITNKMGKNGLGASGNGNTMGESKLTTLASISGFIPKTGQKGQKQRGVYEMSLNESSDNISVSPEVSHLRMMTADWIDELHFHPRLEEWQEAQTEALRTASFGLQYKDTDFELRYEYDLLASNDVETVVQRLQDNAHRLWESAAQAPNSFPLQNSHPFAASSLGGANVKSTGGIDGFDGGKGAGGDGSGPNGGKGDKRRMSEDVDAGRPRSGSIRDFNLGMMMPEGDDRLENLTVLNAKKEHYGTILKNNDEIRKIHQELAMVDPSRASTLQTIIEPTVATIFSVHEVYSFLHTYLFEIDNRMTCVMWRQQEFVELPDPNSSSTSLNVKDFRSNEDTRILEDNRLMVKDPKGVEIIYDVVFEDLKKLEKDIFKLATITINHGLNGKEQIPAKYIDELRLKMAERRSADFQDTSYLNPTVDRSQLLMELYDHEVRFQYAKIELVNLYMEIYEHTEDKASITKLAQIITNTIHMRPFFDFDSIYFSRDYVFQIKSLELRLNLMVQMVRHSIAQHRVWLRRHYMKIDPTLNPEHEHEIGFMFNIRNGEDGPRLRKFLDTPLVAGLPARPENEKQLVTMHHASIAVNITEMITTLHAVADVFEQAKAATNKMTKALECIDSSVAVPRHAVECVAWAAVTRVWEGMYNRGFSFLKPRHTSTTLDSEFWFENPLITDIILDEYYIPYDQSDRGNARALNVQVAPYTMFSDPSFQPKGRDIMVQLLKAILLRNRLLLTWVESENWRRMYEVQIEQMGVNWRQHARRLTPLRFDLIDLIDTTVDDDDGEESSDNILEGESTEEAVDQSQLLLSYSTTRIFDTDVLKVGPLALTELDDTQCNFDCHTFRGLNAMLRQEVQGQMSRALKIQLLERSFYTAAVHTHCLALAELHKQVLAGAELDIARVPEKQKNNRKGNLKNNVEETTSTKSNKYQALVISISAKKKYLRKFVLHEYAKEYKELLVSDIKESEKELAITSIKNNLINWYFNSLIEVVAEECDRAEYAQLVLLFRISTAATGAEFGSGSAKATDNDSDGMQGVQTQDVMQSNGEQLIRLWFIPPLAEVVTLGGAQKVVTAKTALDLRQKLFRNSLVCHRCFILCSLIMDIFGLVRTFAFVLQDNERYAKSVRQLREAEYIVNAFNTMKKDLSHQGSQPEYSRVESYLRSKWNMWALRLQLILSNFAYLLEINLVRQEKRKHRCLSTHQQSNIDVRVFLGGLQMLEKQMPADLRVVLDQHARVLKVHCPDQTEIDHPKKIFEVPNLPFTTIQSVVWVRNMFSKLSPPSKKLCDRKVLEIEEAIEDTSGIGGMVQAKILNIGNGGNGEHVDDRQRAQSDYLLSSLRLLALRREFVRFVLGGRTLKTKNQRSEFFRTYKARILVDAVRLYYRLGARGNAGPTFLLRDEVILNMTDPEVNRLAQTMFERCQVSVLQTELIRTYTLELYRQAKLYYDKLSDERTGRLFKHLETLTEIPYTVYTGMSGTFSGTFHPPVGGGLASGGAPAGGGGGAGGVGEGGGVVGMRGFSGGANYGTSLSNSPYTFQVTEEGYTAKAAMIDRFVAELYSASSRFMKDVRSNPRLLGNLVPATPFAPPTTTTTSKSGKDGTMPEDNKIFLCSKEMLGQAITKLALALNKWEINRRVQREHFTGTLYARLVESLSISERLIRHQAQEKKEVAENFARDVRLNAAQKTWEIHSDFASASVELNELRKSRRIDEKKLRQKIVDEYDDLVRELVLEIHILKNRFNEYRVNTVNEVMNIMSDVKKEELTIFSKKADVPDAIKRSAEMVMDFEEKLRRLRLENHELKMTLMKVRSMYTMKEQSMKSSFDKKFRKLTEERKRVEEKLWESYRDAEAREGTLRKQLAKLQKAHSTSEIQNEILQRQIREEQSRQRQIKPLTNPNGTPDTTSLLNQAANTTTSSSSNPGNNTNTAALQSKVASLQERLRRYEALDIDRIIQELHEKTILLDKLTGGQQPPYGRGTSFIGQGQQSGGAGNADDAAKAVAAMAAEGQIQRSSVSSAAFSKREFPPLSAAARRAVAPSAGGMLSQTGGPTPKHSARRRKPEVVVENHFLSRIEDLEARVRELEGENAALREREQQRAQSARQLRPMPVPAWPPQNLGSEDMTERRTVGGMAVKPKMTKNGSEASIMNEGGKKVAFQSQQDAVAGGLSQGQMQQQQHKQNQGMHIAEMRIRSSSATFRQRQKSPGVTGDDEKDAILELGGGTARGSEDNDMGNDEPDDTELDDQPVLAPPPSWGTSHASTETDLHAPDEYEAPRPDEISLHFAANAGVGAKFRRMGSEIGIGIGSGVGGASAGGKSSSRRGSGAAVRPVHVATRTVYHLANVKGSPGSAKSGSVRKGTAGPSGRESPFGNATTTQASVPSPATPTSLGTCVALSPTKPISADDLYVNVPTVNSYMDTFGSASTYSSPGRQEHIQSTHNPQSFAKALMGTTRARTFDGADQVGLQGHAWFSERKYWNQQEGQEVWIELQDCVADGEGATNAGNTWKNSGRSLRETYVRPPRSPSSSSLASSISYASTLSTASSTSSGRTPSLRSSTSSSSSVSSYVSGDFEESGPTNSLHHGLAETVLWFGGARGGDEKRGRYSAKKKAVKNSWAMAAYESETPIRPQHVRRPSIQTEDDDGPPPLAYIPDATPSPTPQNSSTPSSLIKRLSTTIIAARDSIDGFLVSSTITNPSISTITINGIPLPSNCALSKAFAKRNSLRPRTNYWFDSLSGMAGVWGQAWTGLVWSSSKDNNDMDDDMFGYCPAEASAGSTGCFLNGRELSEGDLTYFRSIGIKIRRDGNGEGVMTYWCDRKGNIGSGSGGKERNPQTLSELVATLQNPPRKTRVTEVTIMTTINLDETASTTTTTTTTSTATLTNPSSSTPSKTDSKPEDKTDSSKSAENVSDPMKGVETPDSDPTAFAQGGQLDLCFALDSTGSMGSYIRSATESIANIVTKIVQSEKADVRFALVAYRDHPPQDKTFVTKVYPFTSRTKEMHGYLAKISAQGGGDGPEAVTAALADALDMPWRPNATKIVVIIADAPPHGLPSESGDGFPNGDPDGRDPLVIARSMHERGIKIYSVACEPALSSYRSAVDFFKAIAQITGGSMLPLTTADLLPDAIIGGAREQMNLDRMVAEIAEEAERQRREGVTDEKVLVEKLHQTYLSTGTRTVQVQLDNIYQPSVEADSNVRVFTTATSLSTAAGLKPVSQRLSSKYQTTSAPMYRSAPSSSAYGVTAAVPPPRLGSGPAPQKSKRSSFAGFGGLFRKSSAAGDADRAAAPPPPAPMAALAAPSAAIYEAPAPQAQTQSIGIVEDSITKEQIERLLVQSRSVSVAKNVSKS
ncbi:hypothetical protein HK102_009028 [Quaeritorhiza haematococci]|nr:hypothetical protein HK102_009028 [Quaeritorhiza haematococci]